MKEKKIIFLFLGLATMTCEGGLVWRSWLGVPRANQPHRIKMQTKCKPKQAKKFISNIP
jgi:hypothetical protein